MTRFKNQVHLGLLGFAATGLSYATNDGAMVAGTTNGHVGDTTASCAGAGPMLGG